MPDGERYTRAGSGKGIGNATPYANLTPEEVAELNARRTPSEQIGVTALCGAKLSAATINRRKGKNKGHLPVTCQKNAGYGTSHPGIGYCKHHGGNTPSGAKSAARTFGRSIIEKQRIDILKFGGDRTQISITPEDALLEEVRRSVAMVRWLEERIGAWNFADLATPDLDNPRLDPDSDRFDPSYRPDQPALGGLPKLTDETFKGNSTFTDEKEWLDLYRREREHAMRVAKLAIDAGIAQRMVSIAEDQGRMLALAIRHVLDALSLSSSQLALVPQVVPRILREVTAGSPLPSAVRSEASTV